MTKAVTVRRHVAALAAGYATFAIAIHSGIPAWVDWPTSQVPADATDLGALVWIFVLNARAALEGKQ
jgi:hypothetical protein